MKNLLKPHVTSQVDDSHRWKTILPFDLVEGDYPLLIGMYIKRFYDTMNRQSTTRISFKRPSGTSERVFDTYISNGLNGNPRIPMDLGTDMISTMAFFMSKLNKNVT